MNAPRKARRDYGVDCNGAKMPGVTTILSHWGDKEGLVHAANQLGLKGETLATWKKKRDIGTVAHAMIEAHLGKTDLEDAIVGNSPDVAVGAAACYGKFAAWWPDQALEVIGLEVQLVDPACGFGGTVDLVARSSEGIALVDWKTGSDLRGEATTMQLGAYAHLFNLKDEGRVACAYAVNIPVDGPIKVYRLDKATLDAGAKAFAALLSIFKAKDNLALPVPREAA